MTQQWNPTGGRFDVEQLENINEVADLPDLAQLDEAQIYSIRSGNFAPDYVVPWAWDSTEGEYQEWRSTVDGQVIIDIPDNEIYLHDDWGDNKLQNRDGSGTTTHNGVEGIYRPEWTTHAGSPSATSESLNITSGDVITTPLNLNLDKTVTWKITNLSAPADEEHRYALFIDDNTDINESEFVYWRNVSGYDLQIGGNDNYRLRRLGDDSERLISSNASTSNVDVTVTRSSSGSWDLVIDGTDEGTATDTTHTTVEYSGWGARSTQNGDLTADEMKVN